MKSRNDDSDSLTSHKFQIIAVFNATEMETGATIMATHTYITTDIIAHYKFSNKLVHMHPLGLDVHLDYHYFNALLPITAQESSTSSSSSSRSSVSRSHSSSNRSR
uniref:Inward rectifier potassium channel irk-1 n=1 Tax=Lygus hesperus TaxID=30085 RepID=A0A0A9ZFB9_LYGHE